MDNSKKTVVISGASRGIGFEIAKMFGKNGYNVAALYNKSEPQVKTLVKALEKSKCCVKIYKVDVKNTICVQTAANQILEDFGSVDVIINNAGISSYKMIQDISDNDFESVINTNLKSVITLTQSLLPSLISNKSGRIINISSIWGNVGAACESLYSASKFAVNGLTKSWAQELSPSGISVNSIAPGVIKTDMIANFSEEDLKSIESEIPLKRLGTPEDVANLALFLASENARYITGQVLTIDGGYTL